MSFAGILSYLKEVSSEIYISDLKSFRFAMRTISLTISDMTDRELMTEV